MNKKWLDLRRSKIEGIMTEEPKDVTAEILESWKRDGPIHKKYKD